MSEWKPIETAPKDGTRVLLTPTMGYDHTGIGYWSDLYGGVWYHCGVGHLNGLWNPTHWMPLPEPPHA